MIVILSEIEQNKKEILREYIDRFTKVLEEVRGTNNKFKCWIFKRGLRLDCMFHEKLDLEGSYSLENLLVRA